jgi:hypothetical protein
MNISFTETKEQFRNHQKHETRRVDKSLRLARKKPGDILQGIERAQGIKKGEHIVKLDKFVILEVNREPLDDIIERPCRIQPQRIVDQYPRKYQIWMNAGGGVPEVVLEGFPELTPVRFVEMFCEINKKCTPDTEITRVLFDYL